MRTFIQRSACNGNYPQGVPGFSFSRDSLVRELTLKRNLPRLIVAPGGYGKSALCAAYAKVMFNFKKTFWFDCSSPCFLRDLDSKVIRNEVFEKNSYPNICVFDDVCFLDAKRKKKFLELTDLLVSKGVEVLVNTSIESKNNFEEGFYTISSNKLLLSDAEKNLAFKSPSFLHDENSESANTRVMCLCFKPKYVQCMFSQLQNYGDKLEALSIIFTIYVLESGKFVDLYDMFGKRQSNFVLKKLKESYPHLGIDLDSMTFNCAKLPIFDIKEGMNFCLSEIAHEYFKKNSRSFLEVISQKLLNLKNYERAFEFIYSFYEKDARFEWIVENSKGFINSHNSSYLRYALRGNPSTSASIRDKVRCLKALINFNDHNNPCIVDSYYSIMHSHSSNYAQRILSLIIFLRIAKGEDKVLALLKLRDYYSAWGENDFKDEVYQNFIFTNSDLRFLCGYIQNSEKSYLEVLLRIKSEIINVKNAPKSKQFLSKNVLYLAISWLFEDLSSCCDLGSSIDEVLYKVFDNKYDSSKASSNLKKIIEFLNKESHALKTTNEENYYFEFALNACVNFIEGYAAEWLNLISNESRRLAIDLLNIDENDKNYNLKDLILDNRTSNRAGTDIYLVNSKKRCNIVEFNFFGTCSVKIADRAIDTDVMHSKNYVLFLFYLAQNYGRESSRQELIDFIWGEKRSKDETKIRSFYQVTSGLRGKLNRALGQEILKKNSAGYYLNECICRSDLQNFNQLCVDLTFNMSPDIPWEEDLVSLIAHMSKPLVATVRKNERLDVYRRAYRNKLADALVSAGETLLNAGEAKSCLWFAREAKHLSPHREDIYLLIMKAQKYLCQRTEAISTYFECKSFMQSELGLTPAKNMQTLYKEIISN